MCKIHTDFWYSILRQKGASYTWMDTASFFEGLQANQSLIASVVIYRSGRTSSGVTHTRANRECALLTDHTRTHNTRIHRTLFAVISRFAGVADALSVGGVARAAGTLTVEQTVLPVSPGGTS